MLYSCAHMATVDVKGLRSDDRGSLISPMWSYDERLDAVYSEFVVTDMSFVWFGCCRYLLFLQVRLDILMGKYVCF